MQKRGLLRTLPGEDEPTVQQRSALGTAAAGLESDRRRGVFNEVPEADILFANESRQAHPIWLALSLTHVVALCLWFMEL